MSQLLCDLFYYSPNTIYTDDMFDQMWNYNKNEFVLILFYLRMHRNNIINNVIGESFCISGYGERKIFHQAIRWMSLHKLRDLNIILPYIPDCGYWKDLLVLMGTPAEHSVVQLFSIQLLKDYQSYNQSPPGPISLASKWTPNEGSSSDKHHDTFGKIAKCMGISRRTLRTKYLVPLRKYLNVTEQLVSRHNWTSINYNNVPRYSLKLHSKSFIKHDSSRFNHYISNNKPLQSPLLPSSVKLFMSSNTSILLSSSQSSNPIIITAPRNIYLKIHNSVYTPSSIFAIDVSGSMTGLPITLASCLCCEYNSQHWIPYHFDNKSSSDNLPVLIDDINFHDKINSIINYNNPGFDINTCVTTAISLGFKHIIFFSNFLIDISELPIHDNIHITYWAFKNTRPTIIESITSTIIEGYDINIYYSLQHGSIITKNSYKEKLLNKLRKENIVTILPN